MSSQGVDYSIVDATAENPGLLSISQLLPRISLPHALAFTSSPLNDGPNMCDLAAAACVSTAANAPPSLRSVYDLNFFPALIDADCCAAALARRGLSPAYQCSSATVAHLAPNVVAQFSPCHSACLKSGQPVAGCDLLCATRSTW